MEPRGLAVVKAESGRGLIAIVCADDEALKYAPLGLTEFVDYLLSKGCKIIAKEITEKRAVFELECPGPCLEVMYIKCEGEACISRKVDLTLPASKTSG